jgi:hypothetical protein
MRLLAAVGLAGACLATSPMFAADLLGSAPPPMEAPPLGQTELGSNWYIRGDVGYGQANESTIQPSPGAFPVSSSYQTGYIDPLSTQPLPLNWVNQTASANGAPSGSPNGNSAFTRGNNQTATMPTFSLGFGYRVNDWFRVEANYQIFKGPGLSAQAQLQCAGTLNSVSNYPNATAFNQGPAIPAGYLYNSSTCNGRLNATQFNNAGFVSAYIDLGHWWLFNPYIGAGAGLNASTINGSLNYTNATTGQAYNGPTYNATAGTPQTFVSQTGVDQYGNAIYKPLSNSSTPAMQALFQQQNFNRSYSSTKYTLAGQLMAGVGIPISQSATLDIGYHVMTLDLRGGTKNLFQDATIGVRYNIN